MWGIILYIYTIKIYVWTIVDHSNSNQRSWAAGLALPVLSWEWHGMNVTFGTSKKNNWGNKDNATTYNHFRHHFQPPHRSLFRGSCRTAQQTTRSARRCKDSAKDVSGSALLLLFRFLFFCSLAVFPCVIQEGHRHTHLHCKATLAEASSSSSSSSRKKEELLRAYKAASKKDQRNRGLLRSCFLLPSWHLHKAGLRRSLLHTCCRNLQQETEALQLLQPILMCQTDYSHPIQF